MPGQAEIFSGNLGRKLSILVAAEGLACADGFVRHVAFAALDAVVNADLADGTERFVVKGRNAQSRAQFFVELPQVLEMRRECRPFLSVVGEQKLLVAGVPQPREPAFQHDGGDNGHLIEVVGALAELCAAAVFFDAHYAARAAHGKPESRETLDGFW